MLLIRRRTVNQQLDWAQEARVEVKLEVVVANMIVKRVEPPQQWPVSRALSTPVPM